LEKEGHNFEIFKALIDRLSSEEKKLIKNFENKIAELIINFAEAVIKKEISVNSEEILKNNIKHALNKLVDKSEVTIYVSPENYDFLRENIDKIGKTFEIENLKVHRLDKVSPGGAIVESSFGSVDATTETQINEFKQLILKNN
jgi:flagellar assembly protein FliH